MHHANSKAEAARDAGAEAAPTRGVADAATERGVRVPGRGGRDDGEGSPSPPPRDMAREDVPDGERGPGGCAACGNSKTTNKNK